MSNALNQNVIQFRALVDADPSLQAEVARHVDNEKWNAGAIIELGKTRGLTFSAEDLVAALQQDDELSDFELELVAAGLSPLQFG